MSHFHFNDSLIHWQTLAGFEYLHYSILDIDEQHHIVDVLFKFAANRQIVLHRHKALNKTFVIQGEHRLYHADGSIKEIRPAGQYTSSPASDVPHREGGEDGVLYEILDDAQTVIGELRWQDLIDLNAAQTQSQQV